MKTVYTFLLNYFRELEGFAFAAKPLAAFICLVIIVFLAWIAHFLTRKVLLRIVNRIAKKTKTQWDDILIKNKVFRGLAHLAPAFIIYYTAGFSAHPLAFDMEGQGSAAALSNISPDYYSGLGFFLIKLARIYFVSIIVFVANSILNAGYDIYNTTDIAHHRPIKGYIQLVKILVYFMAGIMIISIMLERDPTGLLVGLGGLAAVLILVFKDTILGFVASIQLSANNMVKIGDWIEMKSHGADGTVTDITLNTVKVQNWNKTISTIPTYALVSDSFNNWKGMEESGGRRIKRSVSIDMSSVRFCDTATLNRFEKFELIRDYVRQKEEELKQYNQERNLADGDFISGRHQTNVGIFRRYLEVYLRQHPMVNQDMTFLVRQLQPGGKGLPIEIYVFSKDKEWANYEAIQADIFDHILAVVPEFDLRVFQEPTGSDIVKLKA